MDIKKVTMHSLEKLFEDILDKKVTQANVLWCGVRIQVSKYGQTTSQRVADLYKRRRSAGECILCGEKVRKINKVTGKKYRLCDYHREKIDHK